MLEVVVDVLRNLTEGFGTTIRALDSISTGTSPIVSVSWLSMLNMLVTLTKEGTVQVWRARVNQDPNKPHMRANFLEPAGNLLCI